MKKNKEWLKEQIGFQEIELGHFTSNYSSCEKMMLVDDIKDLIDRLDEPEKVVELEQELQAFLNQIYGWASKIEREAIEAKNDEIIDDALIIQETVEGFLYDKGIQPESVLNTENKTNNEGEDE